MDIVGLIERTAGFLWGGAWGDAQILPLGVLVVMLLGAGVYFHIVLRFRPWRRLFPAFGELWAGRHAGAEKGDITPWQALSTALAGQVGTGNLAGVATAISLGGPGAIFWMWVTALLGMALSYAESSLAVKYRQTHEDGRIHGGPMFYIRDGLGRKWGWLALLFALGVLITSVTTGSMIQANSFTDAMRASAGALGMDLPRWAIGAGLAALTFAVIIGGIKAIGAFAEKVVPTMAALYVALAIVILALNAEMILPAFGLIFSHALGLEQAWGGLTGYTVAAAVRAGVARGLFSNEAGQGSTPIAHAAAKTDSPIRQGEIAMLGVFIDTIVICTMTALVIITMGSVVGPDGRIAFEMWREGGLAAASITTEAYKAGLPLGDWLVTIVLFFFVFTTIIGWSYYGEQASTYVFGDRAGLPFRYVWVAFVFIGALIPNADQLFLAGDVANATMLVPNLIAILALSGVVLAMTREFEAGEKAAKAAKAAAPPPEGAAD